MLVANAEDPGQEYNFDNEYYKPDSFQAPQGFGYGVHLIFNFISCQSCVNSSIRAKSFETLLFVILYDSNDYFDQVHHEAVEQGPPIQISDVHYFIGAASLLPVLLKEVLLLYRPEVVRSLTRIAMRIQ